MERTEEMPERIARAVEEGAQPESRVEPQDEEE
jgi:hypothetical protein